VGPSDRAIERPSFIRHCGVRGTPQWYAEINGVRGCLCQYVAIFEWGHNIKRVMLEFIRAMLGVPISNFIPP
jgi:hypothetical protein